MVSVLHNQSRLLLKATRALCFWIFKDFLPHQLFILISVITVSLLQYYYIIKERIRLFPPACEEEAKYPLGKIKK